MAVQYFVPGAGHISLQGSGQRQLPGGIFINENPPTIAPAALVGAQILGNVTLTPHNIVLAIQSVDSDDTIYDGQTNVVILPQSPSTFAASGNRVKIVQGGVTVIQTVTAESASSITITANLTGMTVPGSATLYVGKPV